jgi:hypothetical protein
MEQIAPKGPTVVKTNPKLIIWVASLLLVASAGAAFSAPDMVMNKILRDGQARYVDIDSSQLPPGTPGKLFSGEIEGNMFELFIRDVPAQNLNFEIGFVATEPGKGEDHDISLSANGTPIDANLDVAAKAGGTFKPWVMKTTFSHPGGSLAISFTGLDKPAFVSYLKVFDSTGKEICSGIAADWKKSERLTLLDSRSRPFHPTKVGEIPFFNVDHSPVGSWSSFIYGMTQSGGVQVCKQPGGENGTLIPHQGIIIAVKQGETERLMPFTSKQKAMPSGVLITDKEVTRKLGACTDNWTIPMGVSWTHYTPVWALRDWDKASDQEKRRFVLPVTWMQYHIDNRTGKDEKRVLFSLQQPAVIATGWKGFDGYVVDENSSIAVNTGDAQLMTAEQAKADFGVDGATSAFCIHVPPNTDKTVTFYIAQYRDGVIAQFMDHPLKLMCDALYADVNDMLNTAQAELPAVVARCAEMDQKLASCGQDDERKFNAADSLHSYQYNTILHQTTDTKQPVWAVIEGECSCINTFDLTVDHVFYELCMHPWTVRNELDHFLTPYSFTDQLSLPGQTDRVPGGIGFCHDMGSRINFSTKEKGAVYKVLMTQEELQNWILCASLYWKTTGDNDWIEKNRDTFARCLQSMQRRDDIDPAKRDGITTYVSNVGDRSGEITTYDAMDASLQHPRNSLYIAVKSFACYTMLNPVFTQLGEMDLAHQAQQAEAYTARGILSHWDEKHQCFPSLFDGTSASQVIPAVEGLIYPYAMGLAKEMALDGPNADLIQHLKTHINTVLVPGVCIDAKTGGWNLSSLGHNTWQSKVYISQFVTENILGIKNDATGHNADVAQYAYQVEGAPAVCWTDQIYTNSHTAYGCRHYPRGVTSALWWLWPPDNAAR